MSVDEQPATDTDKRTNNKIETKCFLFISFPMLLVNRYKLSLI